VRVWQRGGDNPACAILLSIVEGGAPAIEGAPRQEIGGHCLHAGRLDLKDTLADREANPRLQGQVEGKRTGRPGSHLLSTADRKDDEDRPRRPVVVTGRHYNTGLQRWYPFATFRLNKAGIEILQEGASVGQAYLDGSYGSETVHSRLRR
jgi:hypothetical protein